MSKIRLVNCRYFTSFGQNEQIFGKKECQVALGWCYTHLKDKYHIEKAFLFIGYLAENEPLYTSLQKCGYIVIFKPTLKRKGGEVKGNVDAELVLHAMIEYSQYDQAIIVTGDGDFYCLVDYLNRQGKLLRLMVPNVHKYSKLLKPFARNKLDFMNNLRKKLEKKKKPS